MIVVTGATGQRGLRTRLLRAVGNGKGLPNPLPLAVIARAHFETVRLPFPPSAVQRAALAVGAPLGKALGYPERVTRRPVYDTRPHGRPQRKHVRGRPHHTASARMHHSKLSRRDERRR